MIEKSGEWPHPDLVEEAIRCGGRAALALSTYVRAALMGVRRPQALLVAVRILGSTGSPFARRVLLALLQDCTGEVAAAAAEALAELGTAAALDCVRLGERRDLPLSNRVAALIAAADGAGSDAEMSAVVGARLHRLLLRELRRGEMQSRTDRLYASALVEGLAVVRCRSAQPAVAAAYERGLLLERELDPSSLEELFAGRVAAIPRQRFRTGYRQMWARRCVHGFR